jgi:hypothetical protein
VFIVIVAVPVIVLIFTGRRGALPFTLRLRGREFGRRGRGLGREELVDFFGV